MRGSKRGLTESIGKLRRRSNGLGTGVNFTEKVTLDLGQMLRMNGRLPQREKVGVGGTVIGRRNSLSGGTSIKVVVCSWKRQMGRLTREIGGSEL